jgi:hypothetical protein
VDKLPKTIAGTVQAILDMKDEKKMKDGTIICATEPFFHR